MTEANRRTYDDSMDVVDYASSLRRVVTLLAAVFVVECCSCSNQPTFCSLSRCYAFFTPTVKSGLTALNRFTLVAAFLCQHDRAILLREKGAASFQSCQSVQCDFFVFIHEDTKSEQSRPTGLTSLVRWNSRTTDK